MQSNPSEYQGATEIDKSKEPEIELSEKIDLFINVVENSDLSKSEKENLLIDDSGIAVLLGMKPVFLADATTWNYNLQIDPAIKIIEDYRSQYLKNPIAQELLENIVVIPGTGYYHVRETKNILKVYRNYFGFSEVDIDKMTTEELSSFVAEGIKSKSDEIKRAILLGYPAGSGKNFDTRIDAIGKINKYFWGVGKDGAEADGWNDHDIDIVDKAYIQAGEKKYAYVDILECLKKYQDKIGLTDDEMQAFSSTNGFKAFGYAFWNIPHPQNELTLHELVVGSRRHSESGMYPLVVVVVDLSINGFHEFPSSIKTIQIS